MPPLENIEFTASIESFVSVVDGKGSDIDQQQQTDDDDEDHVFLNEDAMMVLPKTLSGRMSPDRLQTLVLSERDLVVESTCFPQDPQPPPLAHSSFASNNASSSHGNDKKKKKEPLDLIEIISNLCVSSTSCGFVKKKPRPVVTVRETAAARLRKNTTSAGNKRRGIVYPIARYPDRQRLDSSQLVEQRRKSLEKHLFFRPLPEQATKKPKLAL